MDDNDGDGLQNAAIRALAMAKDMILEAVNTQLPKFSEAPDEDSAVPWSKCETLGIRVGIHCGDVMCGVLGQRLPKFTTCGKGTSMHLYHLNAHLQKNNPPTVPLLVLLFQQ